MTDHVTQHPFTDKYFTKTRNCLDPGHIVRYGVFLRHDSICAVDHAIEFLVRRVPNVKIIRHFIEGAYVPAEQCIFSYEGEFLDLVEQETELLQRIGFPCICAYNAYRMCLTMPKVSFMDMAARHLPGHDSVLLASYGASVGSKTAKLHGAIGFIGSSLDATAKYFGAAGGMGTMPHALVGYTGGDMVEAVKLFIDRNQNDQNVVALIDYSGQELTDTNAVCGWWKNHPEIVSARSLWVRLDTHGGRFLEGLDFDNSVDEVAEWLHMPGAREWEIVRKVLGDDVSDIADNGVRDRVRAILFGKGVSAASIIRMRRWLDTTDNGFVKIVASSGFGLRKCQIMARVSAPIDMIGTGSFLPSDLADTYATSDIYMYDGEFRVKVGREDIFKKVAV